MRHRSTQLSRNSPQYADWSRYVAKLNAEAHRFNSKRRTVQETADYAMKQFDRVGATLLLTVKDRSSAVVCAKELDDFVPKLLRLFRALVQAARLSVTDGRYRKNYSALRQHMVRRAEHWKARAHARSARLVEESPKQRAARRQRVVNPLMKKQGITSDYVWAERAGSNINRNTPRDYRNGKTKALRRSTRQALAQPLGINESDLPR